MIFDQFARHSHYFGGQTDFIRAFEWLGQFSQSLSPGCYEIDGDNIFALVQLYDTVSPLEKSYESHRSYVDIQYVVIGAEIIYYAPVELLLPTTDYNEEKDFRLFADPVAASPLHLEAGSFAVFFPMDGHKPGCNRDASSRVRKVVIKVRV